MSLISAKWKDFEGSTVTEANEQAERLRAAGHEILDLTNGEPDFDTPENAQAAAHHAIEEGYTKYTPTDGSLEMKQAVALKFRRDNDLDYDSEAICISSGAKSLAFHALLATLDAGDEVIIPTPAWSSFPGMVGIAGATPVLLECHLETGYKLTPERLSAAITSRTKCLIVNNPANPTGAVYSKHELRSLGEVLCQHERIAILADEIYEHLVYGVLFTSFASANPGLRDRTVCVNGASKGYAMTGWRIGYAAGPVEVMDTIRKLLSQSVGSPSSVSQRAAIEALTGPQELLVERARVYAGRRDHAIGLLENAPGLRATTPDGAFYLYPDCQNTFGRTTPSGHQIENSAELCRYFLETQGVATVPSGAFCSEGNFRMSYACAEEILDEACRRIVSACQALR